jgi:hypothetical protein
LEKNRGNEDLGNRDLGNRDLGNKGILLSSTPCRQFETQPRPGASGDLREQGFSNRSKGLWRLGVKVEALIAIDQNRPLATDYRWRMAYVTFKCPDTSMIVQHWLDEDDDDEGWDDAYKVVGCPACAKIHLLNRKTGKLLGEK